MNSRQIERCRIEIAAIEAEILAGNPDLQGLCLALSDWSGETGHPPKRGTPPGGNPAARRWCDREDSALERVGALTGLALGGFDGQAELLAQSAADEPADTVGLPSGSGHDALEGGTTRPLQQFEYLGSFATLAGCGGLLGGGGALPRLGLLGRDSGHL